jgi:hypothetical protein
LAKTCDKLGIALWDYLGSRLKVAGHIVIEPLNHYVRGQFRPACPDWRRCPGFRPYYDWRHSKL